ncbi:hypothetical protein [Opitutus terrae]|uniref:Uncharacterized protein n=1 Tax=Opitutus terrae (strain DSM 11246 / JCM 15787 / PB90-1) TaxID=452637 RepID=B1ZYZ5_OPITP|nr:hypothetical protein [Opitutus terrae]ACB76318.1 hypothetical protein Oter_3038 [Opitutus terrae PB90-1]
MHSSTSNSDFDFVRTIPQVPWRSLLLAVTLITTAATVAWELHARSLGYAPTLNDTPDLWAEARASVKPDSLVLIGTSRMLFDTDLDVLEKGLGQRPVQLAIVGSSPFPVLVDLANDESFHGTVLLDIVPLMYLAPGGMAIEASEKALHRYHHWNYSQRWGHQLGVALEHQIAFLKQEDLTLQKLLERLPIPNRANARLMPPLPPYFYQLDRDRRARMFAEAAVAGSPLQQRVANGWLALFGMVPRPDTPEGKAFQQMVAPLIEQRMQETAKHIARIQARGGKVVFLRLPVSGPLVDLEESLAPRLTTWDRLVRDNGVPAIHFAEHPELSAFQCPEWSHLSAEQSVEFTSRLVPHLRAALQSPVQSLASASAPRSSALAH